MDRDSYLNTIRDRSQFEENAASKISDARTHESVITDVNVTTSHSISSAKSIAEKLKEYKNDKPVSAEHDHGTVGEYRTETEIHGLVDPEKPSEPDNTVKANDNTVNVYATAVSEPPDHKNRKSRYDRSTRQHSNQQTGRDGRTVYSYSPMCCIPFMNISQELSPLNIEKRIEIAKYLYDHKKSGASMDEMLFWALTNADFVFADALIDMGVTLQETPPEYYGRNKQSYISIISTASKSVYWNDYTKKMEILDSCNVLPVLERFHYLAVKSDTKLIITPQMLQSIKWDSDSLAFIVKNAEISMLKPKDIIEKAVSNNSIGALEIVEEKGWLSNRKKREEIMEFARANHFNDSLAWLMNFKNRTVDVAKEEAEDEAKLQRELLEDQNSVSAIKKRFRYKKLDDGTLQITDYIGDETDILIPSKIGRSTVTSIGGGAFSTVLAPNGDSRRRIRTVTIPDGVVEIGNSAFCGCESMIEVIIPPSTIRIGSSAFSNCLKLKSINFSKKVKPEKHVFDRCASLFDTNGFIILGDVLYCIEPKDDEVVCEIPNGVKRIAPYAFASDKARSSIKEIRFPEGLKEIGEGAFEKLMGVTQIGIPESVSKIGKKAFYGCINLESVKLPDRTISLGMETFANCGLKEIRIPGRFKILPEKAFYGCEKLRDIYIPFWSLGHLKSVKLPEGVEIIEEDAFFDCNSLKTINIPSSIKEIGPGAFYLCRNLENIVVPVETTVGDGAFAHCYTLKDQDGFIIVNDVLYGYVGNNESLVIPKNVRRISGGAFEKRTGIVKVVLPEGLLSIGDEAFYNCVNLKEINFPNSIVEIGDSAFVGTCIVVKKS